MKTQMKSNRIALFLAAGAVLSTSSALAWNTENETVSAQSSSASKHDGDGRQIAALLPIPALPQVLPKTAITVGPMHHPALAQANEHWRKVTFTVPASLGEAADFCGSTANHTGKVAANKFLETSAWLNTFIKQMSSPPHMSPAMEISQVQPKPALQQVSFHNKRWYMPDGRVKTLTIR
jgi:hypothetical protein